MIHIPEAFESEISLFHCFVGFCNALLISLKQFLMKRVCFDFRKTFSSFNKTTEVKSSIQSYFIFTNCLIIIYFIYTKYIFWLPQMCSSFFFAFTFLLIWGKILGKKQLTLLLTNKFITWKLIPRFSRLVKAAKWSPLALLMEAWPPCGPVGQSPKSSTIWNCVPHLEIGMDGSSCSFYSLNFLNSLQTLSKIAHLSST